VLTDDQGLLDTALIGRIARQMAALHQRGIRVTLVSSGAVGAGVGRTGLSRRPRAVPMLQATAAIGQPALMTLYARTLARFGLHAGQVLVTRTDFEHRSRYINISNTIAALHRLNALPIINENDTISIDELDRFADNDTIAAFVTNLLRADLLVILTVVDGLLDTQGERVDLVTRIEEAVPLVRRDQSVLGMGGMMSKLNAARLVADAGEVAVIACGRQPNVLIKLLAGERIGTIFAPAARKMRARQRWIGGAVRPAGQIMIDDGAVRALRTGGKSLLASGIREVSGRFERGAIVRIVSADGATVAHGLANYSQAELDRIKGLKSSQFAGILGQKTPDEVIHRDNLVLSNG
jgi:glutamate 5-kinase